MLAKSQPQPTVDKPTDFHFSAHNAHRFRCHLVLSTDLEFFVAVQRGSTGCHGHLSPFLCCDERLPHHLFHRLC